MSNLSHLWRQHEHSDVDVCITPCGSDSHSILIPAHKAILTSSPYFRAQMERWLHPAGDGCSVPSSSGRQDDSNSPCPDAGQQAVDQRASLNVRLDNQDVIAAADQLTAAEAVIAAMYEARSLESLTDSQLLSMAITADMLQLDDTAKQAVDCLRKCDEAADVQQQFMALPVWPPPILPLFAGLGASMPVSVVADAWVRNCCPYGSSTAGADAPLKGDMQGLLLDQLGDLDIVWTHPDLVHELMSLPLPALELLMSSDNIQVSSEDNVLYTAQAYADRQTTDNRDAAECRLAPVIRVPSLSNLWQSAAVLAEQPSKLLLNRLAPQLKQYMALTWAGFDLDTAKREMTQPECTSWFLGDRQYSPLPDGVQLTWDLPVSALKAASMRAFTSMRLVTLNSNAVTPPLEGLCWGLKVCCFPDKAELGTGSLGVYCISKNIPQGTYASLSYSFTISSPVNTKCGQHKGPHNNSKGTGWPNFFDLGVMAGGWDEVAWAATGLPTHGTLQLKLKVLGLPHRVRWPSAAGRGRGRGQVGL